MERKSVWFGGHKMKSHQGMFLRSLFDGDNELVTGTMFNFNDYAYTICNVYQFILCIPYL